MRDTDKYWEWVSCSTGFQGQHNCKIHSEVMKGTDSHNPKPPFKRWRESTCWRRLLYSLLPLDHFYIKCIQLAPRYLFLQMPFLLSLTAISHMLFCCASIGSYERSGGLRTGWGPHSFAKWYSGTPITINELVPVQWTGHTGLLVHLSSIRPCEFDSPRPTTLQEAAGIRIS